VSFCLGLAVVCVFLRLNLDYFVLVLFAFVVLGLYKFLQYAWRGTTSSKGHVFCVLRPQLNQRCSCKNCFWWQGL